MSNVTLLNSSNKTAPTRKISFDRTLTNPLPPTVDGTKLLRQFNDCPIPGMAQHLDARMKNAISAKDEEETLKLCDCISDIMAADLRCEKQLKTRVVVKFTADDELLAMTQQLGAIAIEASSLSERIRNLEDEYNKLEAERFAKASSKYGLDLKARSYRVNEVEECIELVEVDCETCVSKTRLQESLAANIKKDSNGPT